YFFFFSRSLCSMIFSRDWSSDVCSSDLHSYKAFLPSNAYLAAIHPFLPLGIRHSQAAIIGHTQRRYLRALAPPQQPQGLARTKIISLPARMKSGEALSCKQRQGLLQPGKQCRCQMIAIQHLSGFRQPVRDRLTDATRQLIPQPAIDANTDHSYRARLQITRQLHQNASQLAAAHMDV